MRLTRILRAIPSTRDQQIKALEAIHKFGKPQTYTSYSHYFKTEGTYGVLVLASVIAWSYMKHVEINRQIQAVQYDVKLYPKPSKDEYRWWDFGLTY